MLNNSDSHRKTQNLSNLVKSSAKYITSQSTHVKINTQKLEEYTLSNVLNSIDNYPSWKSGHFEIDNYDIETIIAYICVIDSLNFCFWPTMKEGYEFEYGDLVNSLNNMLQNDKSFFKAERLKGLKCQELQNVLSMKVDTEFPLLGERCRSLNEMGEFILSCCDGVFFNLLKNNSFDLNLIMKSILQNVSTFRDETIYKGKQVFMYKRIQILAADLYSAMKDTKENKIEIKGVEHLTMFPDYRVPQILCEVGILEYSSKLLADIKGLIEIFPNSEEEIEIRANTITVVERMKELLVSKLKREDIYSVHIDYLLWNEGEKMRKDIVPHHRTLTIFY